MARPLRVEFPGALYHITCRGNDRRAIFLNDTDSVRFIDVLKLAVDFFNIEVISYVLMINHYHLLIRTREANLSRCMQWINTSYTRYFNLKYKRVGHVLQGRFKSIVIGSDDYVLKLSRYIHLNPVNVMKYKKKSIYEKREFLKKYRWSSLQEILQPKKRNNCFNCASVLKYTGGDTDKGRAAYDEFISDGLTGIESSPMDEVKYQTMMGKDDFISWIKEKFIKGKDMKPYTQIRGLEQPRAIRDIANAVSAYCKVETEGLLRQHSPYREARQLLIECTYLSNRGKQSLTEMGKELGGISGSMVSQTHKRVLEKVKKEESFKKALQYIAQHLLTVEA
ncbi:MAG: transposase [bacterium]